MMNTRFVKEIGNIFVAELQLRHNTKQKKEELREGMLLLSTLLRGDWQAQQRCL